MVEPELEHRLTDAERDEAADPLEAFFLHGARAPERATLHEIDSQGRRRHEIDTSPQTNAKAAAARESLIDRGGARPAFQAAAEAVGGTAPRAPSQRRRLSGVTRDLRRPRPARAVRSALPRRPTCARPRERRDGAGRRSRGAGRRSSSSRAGPSDLGDESEPAGRHVARHPSRGGRA